MTIEEDKVMYPHNHRERGRGHIGQNFGRNGGHDYGNSDKYEKYLLSSLLIFLKL